MAAPQNQNGGYENGWAITNCTVGHYDGGGAIWINGMTYINNGVNLMVAGPGDIPNWTIAGQTLNVANFPPPSPWGYNAKYVHTGNTWILNATDTYYQANVWIAASENGDGPPSPAGPFSAIKDQDGYPTFYGCFFCQLTNPGQFDGIVYNPAMNDTYFGNCWYQFLSGMVGPGLSLNYAYKK
jgi:hypothetical protein